jgi:PAS domain S-box-containing protein
MSPTTNQPEKKQKLSHLINENTKLLDNLIRQVIDSSEKKLLIVSDNKIVYANPKSVKAFGISIKDIKDKPVNEVLISKQGGMQLGHYLAMTASLKKNSSESEIIQVIGKNGMQKWCIPSLRRCFWKGKSSILLALDEVDSKAESYETKHDANLRDKLALQAANQCIWDLNINSGSFYICPEFFTRLGHNPKQNVHSLELWFETLTPDSLSAFKKIYDNLKKGQEAPHLWEYQVNDKSHNSRWMLAIWEVVEWARHGIPVRLIGIHMDIDEKKRDDIEKEEFQKTLNGFIQNSLDGLVIINENGIIQEWNPVQEQITLIKGNQAIGKFIWDIQQSLLSDQEGSKEYLSQLKDVFASIAHSGKNPWDNKVVESKIILKNSEVKLIQQSIFIIRTPMGAKIAASVKDITESKISRIKVEKSEERLKLALSAGNVGIWDIDYVTSEKYFSPMVFTIFGYRPWEVEPTEQLWYSMIHPDDIEWVKEKENNLMMAGSSLEIEFRARQKDGKYIWILSKNKILRDDRDKIIRATGTITDITRQKSTESELRLSEEKLTKNLRQHELISEISYILNTNKPFRIKNKEVLKLLGLFTEASRVYIFEHNHEKKITVNTYEWCNQNIEPQINNLQDVSLDAVEGWFSGKDYLTSRSLKEDLPADFAEMMIAQGIKSFLIFPLQVSGKRFGYIGFDECQYERLWGRSETELLKTISNLISFSYERELIQQHYQLNEQRYRELTNMLPQVIFEVSLNGKIDFLNRTGFEFFGISKQKFDSGLYVWDIFPLYEVVRMRVIRNSIVHSTKIEPLRFKAYVPDKKTKPLTIYLQPRMEGGEIVNFSGIALQPEG